MQGFIDRLDPAIEVIRVDPPGVGRSPTDLRPYRLPELAWAVIRLLKDLGYDRVDVLGISWGGALAQQIGLQMADTKHLKFNIAKVRQTGGNVEKGDNGQFQRHYFLEIELLALPEKLMALDETVAALVWEPPFAMQNAADAKTTASAASSTHP